jgi:prevent-host-death family protein
MPDPLQYVIPQEFPMPETTVDIREFQSELDRYLRRAKAGDTITITESGTAVARVLPRKPSREIRPQAPVDSGVSEWNGEKYRPQKPIARNRSRKQISDLVIQNRGYDPSS